ncbi:MAG: amino acid permease [Clostridia bacterium]|nr:amino acid permease [Clostridia bacterium]
MENKIQRKYGLAMAICMVVGIVIGSGIFFKAQTVLRATAGDALMGVLAWIIGGAIMVVLSVTFGVMATKYEKCGGAVDYAEATCGTTYAYFIGWFMSTIYYPAMTSVLAWVSARYTLVAIVGDDSKIASAECMVIAACYLIVFYFINAVAPKLAGRVQVSTTVIKLIPILFIAIVGTVIGLINGNLVESFRYVSEAEGTIYPGTNPAIEVGMGSLFTAVCCTVFAYEGWIIATSLNAEIKDSKKNLPIALGIGAAVIIVAYVLYYVGVLALADMSMLGIKGTPEAFKFFGPVIASVINILIVVSCLGTLNGLMLACTRGFYALSVRGEGVAPETMSQLDAKTNIPNNSSSVALFMCVIWFAYFVGGQFFGWFGQYAFDSSELPIITLYPLYVPILINFMIKEKDLHPVKRFVFPILSCLGVIVIVVASIVSHKMGNLYYLAVFAVFMLVGLMFYRKGDKTVFGILLSKIKKQR